MSPIPLVDECRLVKMVSDPTTTGQRWAERAACVGIPSGTDVYFPEEGKSPSAAAIARCSNCPVATECLATALIHEYRSGDRTGWYGGMSPDAREDIASQLGIQWEPVEIEIRGVANLARGLRSQNRTVPSIAAELGCTERTVYRYLRHSAA